ncbi:MAG: Cof-type HAD-IIB family hydrolase [Coprobacillus sp.]
MNNIEMILTDIDGTLLNSEHQISKYTKETLIEFQRQGKSLILASGRNIDSMLQIGSHLNIKDYSQSGYICLNGLEIYDNNGKCLHAEKQLDESDVVELDKYANKYELDIILFFDKQIYMIEYGKSGIMEYHFLTSTRHKVSSVHEIPKEMFPLLKKVALLQDADIMQERLDRLKDEVKDQYELCMVEKDWIEISHCGVSKGEALKILAQLRNLSLENIAAFGNGENDMSMIINAGVGVAMGNSFESVKNVADYVCNDNDHDGIGYFVTEHFLKD